MPLATFEDETRVIERWNEVFDALAAEPRRQLVVALLDAPPDEPVSLPEAAASPAIPVDRRALRRELVHCHLPKLADHGFVGWEREPMRATRGPRFEEVAVVFEALHGYADGLPEELVEGCRRLEAERTRRDGPERETNPADLDEE